MISTIREKLGTRWLNIFVWAALISMSGIFIVGDFFKNARQRQDWVLKIGRQTLGWPEYAARLETETRRLDAIREKYGVDALNTLLSSQSTFTNNPQQNVVTNFVQGVLFALASQKLNLTFVPATVLQEFIERLQAGLVDPHTGKINKKLLHQAF